MEYEGIEFLSAAGWQNTDDEHPVGTGKPGYRLVFKTLKILPLPSASLEWPNLKISLRVDKTTRGKMLVQDALSSRKPNKLILPEYIDVHSKDKSTNFVGRINMKFAFNAHEEEIDTSGLVEMLLITDADKPEAILQEGRFLLSKIKLILELTEGERLLGLPLTEEVVEIFEDWHWNRNLGSLTVGSESQLNMKRLDTNMLLKKIKPALENTQAIEKEERTRLNVASEWYWKADAEQDTTNRFIQYWIAIEALEMPNTTNIKPIKSQLAKLTKTQSEFWDEPIGKLFGLRSKLVHGKLARPEDAQLRLMIKVAQALLYGRLFPHETSAQIYRDLISLLQDN